jgi:predicted AlkP superfamily pyrophosphatase or phosphodiesterase
MVVVISLDGFPAYALEDPRLPVPTLRTLAHEGTVAASMRPVNPTVTWPNHTAIVTGVDASEHLVLYNGLLTPPTSNEPPKIEPWHDKEQFVHAPTIYDVAHDAGLTTAQVDWVAIYHAKKIDWSFPELPDPNGEIERKLIADGVVTSDQLRTFENSSQAWQDQIWTDAAVRILRDHQPNLLLLHLLTLDDTNHETGPMSGPSFTAMALLDAHVKRIVDALQDMHLTQRATVIVVSDHGFRKIDHKIRANVILRHNGLISGSGDRTKADAWVVAEGGAAMLYVTNTARRAELSAKLTSLFAAVEGIGHVYGTSDLQALGLPTRDKTHQSPDLVLAAKPGYSVASEQDGDDVSPATGGSHGYLNSDPNMQAIFLAWGNGIRKGIHLNAIANVDVAPTIAALFGLEWRQAKGRVLDGALENARATVQANHRRPNGER